GGRQMDLHIKNTYEQILVYARNLKKLNSNQEKDFINTENLEYDGISFYKKHLPLHNSTTHFHINNRPNLAYSIYYNNSRGHAVTVDEKQKNENGSFLIGEPTRADLIQKGYERIIPKFNSRYNNQRV